MIKGNEFSNKIWEDIIIALFMYVSLTGCAQKKIDGYNITRVTNDKKFEQSPSFVKIGEELGICYIPHVGGGINSEIDTILISSKKYKKIVLDISAGEIPSPFICDIGPHLYGMEDKLVFDGPLNILSEHKTGIGIANSDGSLIDGHKYKIVFESKDPASLEGCLNGEIYVKTFPSEAEPEYYKISLNGNKTRIDELPEALETKNEILGQLTNKLKGRIALDFIKTNGDITHIIAGDYGVTLFGQNFGKWDIYLYNKDQDKQPKGDGTRQIDGTLKSIASFDLEKAIKQKDDKLQGGWYR